ncbi:MAG: flippase-like domain-containing protein [Polyangiaceae bacterium]|nr:flippase-like domain-containing protein [Polyangiaceae bacterium]
MNRAALIRGIQLIVAITLATFAYLLYDAIREQRASLTEGFADANPFWLLFAAVLALQEGVIGGVRAWVLGRVLYPSLRLRTAVTSEFVLMFCSGVTPGQTGGPPTQAAVLAHGGMGVVNAATTEFVIAACTILFFLSSAVAIFALRAAGLFAVEGGAGINVLLAFTIGVYCLCLVCLVLGAASPSILKAMLRLVSRILSPLWRGFLRLARRSTRLRAWAEARLGTRGVYTEKLAAGIDDCHEGFAVYVRRGKAAFALAMLLTVAFFWVRFATAYFILLGLGIPTTPSTYVTVGPPILQIILVQSLLNFALYLSPTPGASGVAEAGSTALMAPWVRGVHELPYLVLWRVLTLFLCMFVGGLYVFRYLGTDVLEKQVKEAEDAKKALEQARLAGALSAPSGRDAGKEPPGAEDTVNPGQPRP